MCSISLWPASGPNEPTEAEVDRHNLTHSNSKPWCAHGQAGLAQRDRHVHKPKPKVKEYPKRTAMGEADVPDTDAKEGVAKFSIDYFKMLNADE